MTTLEKIRRDMLASRKARDPIASTLVTLAGEIQAKEKTFSPARPIEDVEVLAIVRKFIKGAKETETLLQSSGDIDRLNVARAEIVILEAYLPKQLTEDGLRAFAEEKAKAGAKMGDIMKALKDEYPGQYDGRLASQVVKSVIG